jgi:hypothetical protein
MIRDMANKYLPCPNELDISASNQYAHEWMSLYLQSLDKEREDGLMAELLRDLKKLREAIEPLDLPDLERTKGQLDVYQDIISDTRPGEYQAIENPALRITRKMSALACSRCTGIVVDLRDGKAYCGRTVPQEIRESNEALQTAE